MSRVQRVVSIFNPATSIANVIAGFDQTSGFWQDVARSVSASADGDPVRVWDDLGGSSRNEVAPTVGARPLLKVSPYAGTSKALLFDGFANFMKTASIAHGVGIGDVYIVIVGCMPDHFWLWQCFCANGGGIAPGIYNMGGQVMITWGSTYNFTDGSFSLNTRFCLEVLRSSGVLSIAINGIADSSTPAVADSMDDGILYLGADDSFGSDAFTGHLEAVWLYKTTPTSQQRAAMRAHYGF